MKTLPVLITLLLAWPLAGAAADAEVAVQPVATDACRALVSADFSGLPDAPTTITAVQAVAADDGLPNHCQVEGRIAPAVHFNLRLPSRAWNGRVLMQGCGGLCGSMNPATCDDVLARNYAVVVTDMGHQGKPWESAWAHDNLPAEIDFAYRATHVVAVAAKAIVAAYYGEPARRSYFQGCSTGGRQGLVAAQRFPADFDGIIAGAPVLDETGVAALHLIWSGRANLDAQGGPLLSPEKVARLHRAVLEACDADDGLRDGVIEDPRDCRFDVAALDCRRTGGSDCLTVADQAAVNRLYHGARDSSGRDLWPGGLMPGSEYEWVPNFVGRDGPAVFHPDGAVSDLYRYLIFMPDPASSLGAAAFDFDRDPPRLALMESLYSARNPDLSAFRARGGRLILYHGWDDAEIPPRLMLDYFAALQRAMGGAEATGHFARLFMLPGVAHCRRGPGADTADWLTALEHWVERSEPPDMVLTHRLVRESTYLGLPRPRFPLSESEYERVRPVYPYPDIARYSGQGNPADAGNWQRVRMGVQRDVAIPQASAVP